VERARIAPPRGRIGPLTAEERKAALAGSPLAGRYDAPLDRESAYEALQGRATTAADAGPVPPSSAPTRGGDPWGGGGADPWWRTGGGGAPARPPAPSTVPRVPTRRPAAGTAGRRHAPAERDTAPDDPLGGILGGGGGRGRGRQSPAEAMATSMARSLGTTFGRKIGGAVLRGVLGSILKR